MNAVKQAMDVVRKTMKVKLSRKQMMIAFGVVAVAMVVVVYLLSTQTEAFTMSLYDDKKNMESMDKKEDFHNNIEVYRESVPKRHFWNMSDVTTNTSYDVRGETHDIVKEPVSMTYQSELDGNLTNMRVSA